MTSLEQEKTTLVGQGVENSDLSLSSCVSGSQES